MNDPISTDDELRNHALALEVIYQLNGPGGAYHQMASQQLPEEVDW